MKVIGKDRTSCDVCNPIDEILARLDALERRASAIVAKVQGIAPDGEGNVTLPTSSSDRDPLHGRVDAFAMSSEVKEAADDAHAYAASIADDVLVINSEIDALNQAVAALQPAEIEAIKVAVETLQTTVATLESTVATLNNSVAGKVSKSGDTMTGPLNVIDTVTGNRNTQAVNGNRLQNDLDAYESMVRTTGNQQIDGLKSFSSPAVKAPVAGVDFINLMDQGSNVRPAELSQALIAIRAKDDSVNALIQIIHNSDGGKWLQISFTGENGTTNTYVICGINADGSNIIGGYR